MWWVIFPCSSVNRASYFTVYFKLRLYVAFFVSWCCYADNTELCFTKCDFHTHTHTHWTETNQWQIPYIQGLTKGPYIWRWSRDDWQWHYQVTAKILGCQAPCYVGLSLGDQASCLICCVLDWSWQTFLLSLVEFWCRRPGFLGKSPITQLVAALRLWSGWLWLAGQIRSLGLKLLSPTWCLPEYRFPSHPIYAETSIKIRDKSSSWT